MQMPVAEANVQILSDITVHMKYAKHLREQQRREVWPEIVERNCDMHVRKYPQLAERIRQVYRDFVLPKLVLPSMRSMQFAGLPIELANNRIFNCAYLPAETVEAFCETKYLLLGGTGVGFSVQRQHVAKLPPLLGPKAERTAYVIEDSIEGWANAVDALICSYSYGREAIDFDFTLIRPEGAPLVTTGGKAPGPEPLIKCLREIRKLLDRVLSERGAGTKLKPIDVHDVLCHAADAVRAGGIRRSAMISLFSPDDEEMLRAKGNFACEILSMYEDTSKPGGDNFIARISCLDYAGRQYDDVELHISEIEALRDTGTLPWYKLEPQRGRANNSAALLRGETTHVQFKELWDTIVGNKSGEPGVYFTHDLDWGTNPCCEIALKPYQFCNLTEINAHFIASQADLNARAQAAAFIGTLQAGYTDFPYLRDIWRQTTEEDALIGVGMTGIGSGSVLPYDLEEAAKVVVATNREIARIIGINPAQRTTTIKPAGTSSLTLGCASGIHAWHNDYYLRRIQVGKSEAIYQYLAKHHPELVADSAFSPAKDAVIEVPVKAPEGSMLRYESAMELLERVKRFNLEWVRAGHVSGANTHNVSCTISVKEDEWPAVGQWMWDNRNNFNGIAVLPYDGGTYLQAPFEDIDQATYERLTESLTRLDLTKVVEVDDNTDLAGEVACAGGMCEWTAI